MEIGPQTVFHRRVQRTQLFFVDSFKDIIGRIGKLITLGKEVLATLGSDSITKIAPTGNIFYLMKIPT